MSVYSNRPFQRGLSRREIFLEIADILCEGILSALNGIAVALGMMMQQMFLPIHKWWKKRREKGSLWLSMMKIYAENFETKCKYLKKGKYFIKWHGKPPGADMLRLSFTFTPIKFESLLQ